MPITHLLQPNPKWYFVNLSGLPLGAGYLAVYSSLNHNIQKLVYETEDVNTPIPWPTIAIPNTSLVGVHIDLNGTQGPFYFAVDSNNPDDRYFLRAYDKDGVLIWSQDNFPSEDDVILPENTIGLSNLVVNNVFWRNIGTSSTPIGAVFLPLAPSVHEGFTLTSSLTAPDICLIKNNTAASDTVSFVDFGIGSNALTPDITPPQYLNYTCSNTPVGETFKYIQIPITQNVNYLSGQEVTASIWARCNSGNNVLSLNMFQFFGDGTAASAPLNNLLGTANLTSAWEKFTFTATLQDISGKTFGQCGNSGLFLQILLPLSAACNIDLIKPCAYIGNSSPEKEYQTESQITAITDSPRTSDIRQSFNYTDPLNVPGGWILVTGSTSTDINLTIGSPTSNADQASLETFPLYNNLWNLSSTYCPLMTSGGVPIARGSSAIADFSENNQMVLPQMGGRTFSGALTNGINYTQTITNVNTDTNVLTINDTRPFVTGEQVFFGVYPGGVLPSGILINPTAYYIIVLSGTTFKLAMTYAGAISLTANVSVGTAGTPYFYMAGSIAVHPNASYMGQDSTPPTLATLYPHTHGAGNLNDNGSYLTTATIAAGINVYTPVVTGAPSPIVMNAGASGSAGGGNAFNTLQPTVYGNYLIKL